MFIRFIRSDGKLNIFGERFLVSKELIYSYVKAVIVTGLRSLEVYQGDDLIQAFPYEMPAHVYN